MTRLIWRKSTYTGSNGGNCVEVASNLHGLVAVRDSKDPCGPALTFGTPAWETLLGDIKAGELDLC